MSNNHVFPDNHNTSYTHAHSLYLSFSFTVSIFFLSSFENLYILEEKKKEKSIPTVEGVGPSTGCLVFTVN